MALSNETIESKLADELLSLTPSFDETLLDRPFDKASGGEWYLPGASRIKALPRFLYLAAPALAAALFLTLAAYYVTFVRVYSSVYVDVNPSICLSLNRLNQVVKVEALNDDALSVLDGAKLKGRDAPYAVTLLVERMVRDGYLTQEEDLVLISVENENQQAGDRLAGKLTNAAYQKLEGSLGCGQVLGQRFPEDPALRERSRQLGISPGKERLIERMAGDEPPFPREQLAGFTLAELSELMDGRGKELGAYADRACGARRPPRGGPA